MAAKSLDQIQAELIQRFRNEAAQADFPAGKHPFLAEEQWRAIIQEATVRGYDMGYARATEVEGQRRFDEGKLEGLTLGRNGTTARVKAQLSKFVEGLG